MTGISCAGPGDRTAIAFYASTKYAGGALLISEANGHCGQPIDATLPPDAITLDANDGVGLDSVSCPSPGSCAAVGSYVPDTGTGNTSGVLLDETNGTWAPGTEVIPPGKHPYYETNLESVSCATPGNCTAVGVGGAVTGTKVGIRHLAGLLLTETNGQWAKPEIASLPANANALQATTTAQIEIDSVSCSAPGDCTAVGQYLSAGGHRQGLLLTKTNGVWAPGVEAQLPAGASNRGGFPFVTLRSVSCASPGNCSAVGAYAPHYRQDISAALLLTERDGRWSPGGDPNTSRGRSDEPAGRT